MPIESNRTREAIYSALFNLLKVNLSNNPNVPVVTFGRRSIDWKKVPSNAQPALIMLQGEEEASRTARGLVRWRLKVLLLYYFLGPSIGGFGTEEPSPPPVTQVNNIIDAIETVILTRDPNGNPIPMGTQTLGGLVNDVYIDGTVAYDQLVFDTPGGQGLITIPVTIEVGQ